MTNQKNAKGPRWGIIVTLIGVLFLISMIGSGGNSSSSYDSHLSPRGSSATTPDVSSTFTPRADALTSTTGAYMDEREKQLYEQDPSSMGYTDADRDFLKEHGVSEQEARAVETVFHREGIDD